MNVNAATAVSYTSISTTTVVNKGKDIDFKDTYKSKKEYKSAVAEFKKRHPDNTHVDVQVRAGKNLIKRCNADGISRDAMTMDEYKDFFMGLMDKIPYDISQKDTHMTWSMTEAGWEQMKNDPDYEAWVLGYTVEDRSVHFPFKATHVNFEKFGATIEEHHGEGFNVFPEDSGVSGKKEESWWYKRHKKMEELLKKQGEEAHKKAVAKRKAMQEQWYLEQAQSSLRMQQYFSERISYIQNTSDIIGNNSASSVSAGIDAYESSIDLVSSPVISGNI